MHRGVYAQSMTGKGAAYEDEKESLCLGGLAELCDFSCEILRLLSLFDCLSLS